MPISTPITVARGGTILILAQPWVYPSANRRDLGRSGWFPKGSPGGLPRHQRFPRVKPSTRAVKVPLWPAHSWHTAGAQSMCCTCYHRATLLSTCPRKFGTTQPRLPPPLQRVRPPLHPAAPSPEMPLGKACSSCTSGASSRSFPPSQLGPPWGGAPLEDGSSLSRGGSWQGTAARWPLNGAPCVSLQGQLPARLEAAVHRGCLPQLLRGPPAAPRSLPPRCGPDPGPALPG